MYYGCADEISLSDDRQPLWQEQREERGFDETELWNLDITVAKFILPRLKAFKEYPVGQYPRYPATSSPEEYESILSKMINSFEMCFQNEYYFLDKEQLEVFQEGIMLFAKYYRHLWV